MKINYAIVASTSNPEYLDFWPVISKVWKERFNVTPVLGLISESDFSINNTEEGIVINLKRSDVVDEVKQSQICRLYLPKFLNGVCIISDIDMIPISKKYFIDDLVSYNQDDFVITSSHHEQTINTTQYPMCYVIGHNQTFEKIFNLDLDWSDFLKKIPNHGWFSDQVFLYQSVKNSNYPNVKFPYRDFSEKNIRRIDRSNWRYNTDLLKEEYYIDSHLLRPYGKFKNNIDELISYL